MRLVNDDGVLLVKTYESVLAETAFNAFQRKRLSASGESPTYAKPAIGLTKPRPVVIEDIGYCGKEVLVDLSEAPADEGLTPEELNGTIPTEYRKPAAHEARKFLAKGVDAADIARLTGVHRTTVRRIQNGQKPNKKTNRRLRRACRLEVPDNLVDDNDLRELVRAVGIKEIAKLADLGQRTVFYFMKGRKPHNSTLDKIRFAVVLAAWKNGWVARRAA